MKESAQTLHTAHRDKSRHWHLLMLLLPSMAFVLVLSLFMRNRYSPNEIQTTAPAAITLTPIVVKNTTVNVRMAVTDDEQKKGLSGVTNLPENEGMLFVFPRKTQPPFWMKDMLIPLDLIWIKDGKIIQLNKNIAAPIAGTPDSKLQFYIPIDLVDHVLEVNAGFIDWHNIVVGDSVTIP